jgi:F0F1-type ATP synthase assembly protein I
MIDTEYAALTGDEIAVAKSAIRTIRTLTAVGTAIALPIVILFALPVLAYALVGAMLLAPLIVGYVLLSGAPKGEIPARLTSA